MVEELNQAATRLDHDLGSDQVAQIQDRWERGERENPGSAVFPLDAEVLATLDLATAAQLRGDIDQAIHWNTKALGDGIWQVELRRITMSTLGVLLEKRGDLDKAIRWYTEAAEAGEVLAMPMLGHALLKRNDPDRAIDWFRKALEIGSPDAASRADWMFGLGRAYHWREDLGQAIECYTKALEGDHFSAAERGDIMVNLGEALDERGETAQAVYWFTRAEHAGDSRATKLKLAAGQPAVSHGNDQPAKSGCYIATAVYGSYDAAPVLTLRRFRDADLATSPIGRAFIRGYYAVSPALARHFEQATVLNRVARWLLDIAVRRLDDRGYSDARR